MSITLSGDHVERAAHFGFELIRAGESARVCGEQRLETFATVRA